MKILKKLLIDKSTLASKSKYFVLAAFIFSLGLVWNFPLEKIWQSVSQKISQQTGYEITADRLHFALPLGLKGTNVRVQGKRGPLGPMDLDLNRVKVTASPFTILTYPLNGSASIGFSSEYRKSRWSGDVDYSKDLSELDLKIRDFSFEKSIELGSLVPILTGSNLLLQGNLESDVSFSNKTNGFQTRDFSTSNGKLNFILKKFRLDFANNMLRFEQIRGRTTIDNGTVNIESIALSGPDVTGTANGSLKFDPYFDQSQLKLEVKLTITENAKSIREMVSTYGSMFGLNVNESGVMAFRVEGPIVSPRIQSY